MALFTLCQALPGFAPLLVDFPAELDGVPVLLCWLEGDAELSARAVATVR